MGGALAGLESSEYSRAYNERAYADMKDREAQQRTSGFLGGLAKVGGPILGGIIGGPVGAIIGGGIGGGISSLSGPSDSFTSAGGYTFGGGMPYKSNLSADIGRPSFRNTFSGITQEKGNLDIGKLQFGFGG